MSGASPPSCFSSVSTALFVFAIKAFTFLLDRSAGAALDQRRQPPFRLVPRRPEPLLLQERRFVPLLLQPGRRRVQRGGKSGLGRQRVDDQNEIATGTFRVRVTAGEGERLTSRIAQPVRQSGQAGRGQYGIEPFGIKRAVEQGCVEQRVAQRFGPFVGKRERGDRFAMLGD